jgi:hypothetical protein
MKLENGKIYAFRAYEHDDLNAALECGGVYPITIGVNVPESINSGYFFISDVIRVMRAALWVAGIEPNQIAFFIHNDGKNLFL